MNEARAFAIRAGGGNRILAHINFKVNLKPDRYS